MSDEYEVSLVPVMHSNDMVLTIPPLGDLPFDLHITVLVIQQGQQRWWGCSTQGKLANTSYSLRIPERVSE